MDEELRNEIRKDAERAAALEDEAKELINPGKYTHVFDKPFTCEGHTFTELHFDWESLTGADCMALEREVTRKGRTLVSPAFTLPYVAGMVVRACTDRDEDGRRIFSENVLKKLPMVDFNVITGRARGFLLRSGS